MLPDDPITRAYIAGLFDGEGSITRQRWPVLQVGMTDEGVIRWLAAMGGSLRVEQPPGNRQLLYRWRVLARREVIEMLEMMLPYLRVKRKAAIAVLEELLALERISVAET